MVTIYGRQHPTHGAAPAGQVWVFSDGRLLHRPETNPLSPQEVSQGVEVKFPDGSTGTATQETDNAGNQVFLNLQTGSSMTFREGRTHVGREASPIMQALAQQGHLQELIPLFGRYEDIERAFAPTAAERTQDVPGMFESQAREQAAPFFDKDLELLRKELDLAKDQRKQVKEFQEKFQKEAEQFQAEREEQFFRLEDKGFANELQKAQSGFAGRGTLESGFRLKAMTDLVGAREEGLGKAGRDFAEIATGFREATEGREVGFEQALQSLAQAREQGELGIARARESDVRSRERQLEAIEADKRRALTAERESAKATAMGEVGMLNLIQSIS
jgi:hypothetical protein